MTWNGFTWMWNGCPDGLWLISVHSSTAPRFTVWSTRSASKRWLSTLKFR